MRKLVRDEAPACLGGLHHERDHWDDLGDRKNEIQTCLERMQGRRCAYCEGPLDTLGAHIEHFRRRKCFPALTFSWTNLFWSCNQYDSCGHYKDSGAGAYDVDHLIDPCLEDPDKYFRFRSDGTISIRHGLSDSEKHKAEETLRVFNLHPNWGRLRNMRKAVLAGYANLVEDAAGFPPTELCDLFKDELAATADLPFSTAIRHVLTKL